VRKRTHFTTKLQGDLIYNQTPESLNSQPNFKCTKKAQKAKWSKMQNGQKKPKAQYKAKKK
jgi:hypothetical protein